MARIRLCLVGAIALVAVSCQDHGPPTAASPPISAQFLDAMHGGGNPHFFLLPPFVSLPDLTKETFESGLQPSVRITEQPDGQPKFTGCTDNQPIDYLPATEFTRFKAYAAFWRPANYPATVAPPCIYRLQVEVLGTKDSPGAVLGFADVQVISKTTIQNLTTREVIPLPKDLTLPFWFFIGQGAVFYAQTHTNACEPGRDCAEAVIDPAKDNTIVTKNLKAGIFIPAGAFASPNPITLVIEQQTVRPCIPPDNLGLPQFSAKGTGCYRYQRFPDNVVLTKDLTVAMCVEVGLLTHDQADRLQIFRFDSQEPVEGGAPTATALQNAPAGFLPCETIRYGSAFVPRLLDKLAALVAPRVLQASAINLGVGGTCIAARCLSSPIFTWGMPGTLNGNSTDPQSGTAGQPVQAPPSVKLLDPGNLRRISPIAPQPIAGVPVTFRVSGGGSIVGPPPAPGGPTVVVVPTNSDGVATLASWTLGPTAGTNTVVAEVPGADGGPVTFTATASGTGVHLLGLSLNSTTLVIEGPLVPYTATITNGTGQSLSRVVVQAWIDQPGNPGASRAAAGSTVTCGAGDGTLPPGSCAFGWSVNPSNLGAGTGVLTAGSASARFELIGGSAVLDVVTVPVTLINPPVGIARASVSPSTLPIGGLEGTATVTVSNTTNASAAGLIVEGWIRQGTVRQTAGQSRDPFTCAAGITCDHSFNFVALSTPPGLRCGNADAEFDLKQAGTFLHRYIIPITLSSAGPCP